MGGATPPAPPVPAGPDAEALKEGRLVEAPLVPPSRSVEAESSGLPNDRPVG